MSVVTKVGGFDRTCLVVDLYTAEPLTSAQIALIEDQIGLVLSKMQIIYRSDVVGPNRFITPLKAALRLK